MKMKKTLIIFAFTLIIISQNISAIEKQDIYSISVTVFRADKANLEDFQILEGFPTVFPSNPTGYQVKIISYKNEVLFEKNFGISFIPEIDVPNPEDFASDHALAHFRLPIYPDGEKIEISKGNNTLLQIQIAKFVCKQDGICSKFENELNCPSDCKDKPIVSGSCGNQNCDATESYITCPADCPSGSADKVCDRVKDNICDPDCSASLDPDCIPAETIKIGEKNEVPAWLWLVLFGVGVVFIVLIILIISRKQAPPPQEYQRR